MTVGFARATAAEWVLREASHDQAFGGAYFSGSTVTKPDNAIQPASSDVDIMVITALDEAPMKLGKFYYRGVLLEVTYLSWRQLATSEAVLSSYHLAGGFRADTIIADPTGRLHELQAQVSRQFADIRWVRRRCEDALSKIRNGLRSINSSAPLYDQVTSWLFPTGITTHVLLVAALRNPTVRLRYLAAREVLNEYGYTDFYPALLELLGCTRLSPRRVQTHLDNLARTFDAAAAAAKTPFFFSSDITSLARPVVIDGSRELIKNGLHREAVFWIVATFARCHKILGTDAPELQKSLAADFEDMLSDLGINSAQDLISRAEEVLRFLPGLWEVAADILLKNPEITGK